MNLAQIQSAAFLGSKPLGLAILKSLVAAEPSIRWTIFHPDDLADPRSNYASFHQFSRDNDINLNLVKNRREAEVALAEVPYDIAFVCGWYWLLADHIVGDEAPPVYGIHNSLLPKYRGGAPLVWPILNGESEVGGSLFRLSPGVDDGDIALQVKVAVEQDASVGELLEDIQARFKEAIPMVWRSIISGYASLIPQDNRQSSYFSQRRPEDGLIDWFDTAQNINNFIRAQSSPYPCAYTFCKEKKVYIDRARVFSAPFHGRPGQISERSLSHVSVATGAGGALRVIEAHDMDGELDLRALFPSESRLRQHN